jgi:hypothetical protein
MFTFSQKKCVHGLLMSRNVDKPDLYLFNIFFSPSGVRALPLAAGRNEGGQYLRYFFFGLSEVHAPAEQLR